MKIKRNLLAGVLSLVLSTPACTFLAAQEGSSAWPAFLGEGASKFEAAKLPLTWSPTENVAWRADVPGHGQSSPVIWKSKVFVSTVEGANKDQYHVLAFDLLSGKQLWKKSIVNSAPVASSVYVSRAAPTPVVDSARVVVQFESGDVIALTHSGEQLWTRNLSKDYGPFVAEFGFGASPCQTDAAVYVLLEHDGPSALVALDKATGYTLWKSDRKERRSWSSPAVIRIGGIPQIVVSSAGSVDGYDAATGKQLWTFTDIGGNTATTPIDCGEGRFLVAASAGRQGENAGDAKKSNCMLQVTADGDSWKVNKLWVTSEATPSWASPIIHQGLAYWVNRVGVVYCIDAATGESVYTERTKQSCWATPFAVDDRIYFFGKEGTCSVLAAGKEFRVLAENVTWSDEDLKPEESLAANESTPERRQAAAMFSGATLYGFAVAPDRFVIRIGNQLFCVAAR